MVQRELAFLYAAALTMPSGARCVEIGSWKGRSTVAICEGLRTVDGASLCAVDTFHGDARNDRMHARFRDELAADEVYRSFREHTADYEFLTVERTTSREASHGFENESLDWVFIDAEHTFDHVLDDVRHWLPKVKLGGLISGHDYGHASVRFAVHSCLSVDGAWESIWYSRRRPGHDRNRVIPLVIGRAYARMKSAATQEQQLPGILRLRSRR
jgi:hypothetical protein